MAWLPGPHDHEEGFNYSPALEKFKGQPWTFDALNHWLDKPAAYAPGTRMTFAGITSAKQRADVIAYLRTLSDNPAPLPPPEEAKPAAAPAAAAGTAPPPPAAPAAPAGTPTSRATGGNGADWWNGGRPAQCPCRCIGAASGSAGSGQAMMARLAGR